MASTVPSITDIYSLCIELGESQRKPKIMDISAEIINSCKRIKLYIIACILHTKRFVKPFFSFCKIAKTRNHVCAVILDNTVGGIYSKKRYELIEESH